MLYLKELWFWLSLVVLPIGALFGAGYLLGQILYSEAFKFESVLHFSIVSFCICSAFQFYRTLNVAKGRFKAKSV